MIRSGPALRAARLLARLPKGLNRLLDRMECARPGDAAEPLPHRPVFIVGPPRSGSTLLTQVLVHTLDLGYFTNAHARLHGAPSLAERLLRTSWRVRRIDFRSDLGRTRGWLGPSECAEYWYRFFRRSPQYVPRDEARDRDLARLRTSMRAVLSAFGRPLLVKNLISTLRLGPLVTALPESLFLVTERNRLDVARSLLRSRLRYHGTIERWLSSEPPDVDALLRLPPEAQVAGQIRSIESLVEEEREISGPARFLTVRYEDLCENPAAAVAAVQRFLGTHGTAVAAVAAPPPGFRVVTGEPLPDLDLDRRVEAALAGEGHS